MSALRDRINIFLFFIGLITILTSLWIFFDSSSAAQIITSIIASTSIGIPLGAIITLYIIFQSPRQFTSYNFVRYTLIIGLIISILYFLLSPFFSIYIPFFPVIGDSIFYIIVDYSFIVTLISLIIGVAVVLLSTRVVKIDSSKEPQVRYVYNIIDMGEE